MNDGPGRDVGKPANDKDGSVVVAVGLENPTGGALERPAANAPIPTTEPTAARGNMSLASVYTLADHAWCAATATLTISTAVHMLPASGANAVGTINSAIASIALFLARFTVQPRLIKALDSHPPPIEPTSDAK